MMELHGKNLIAGHPSAHGESTFRAIAPKRAEQIGPPVFEATLAEVDLAATVAEDSFESYAAQPPASIASLLEKIAEEIMNLGDDLIQLASDESALPPERLTGERGRTVNQLRMFATLVRDGAWKEVRIDTALPDRKPLRRPDLRRTLIPVGPVAVWAASNFPLAFSVAGGDTAAALAAGCPVVVKAHPGHPGTSEMVAIAITRAVAALGMSPGIFSLLHGVSSEVSVALVRHPKIAAGAFTGSLRAGRALFDAAASRPTPIPFFAEMGSVNPVFLLPGALAERADAIAEGVSTSVNLGVGQFCTCPGVLVAMEDESAAKFVEQLRTRFEAGSAGTMLTFPVARAYRESTAKLEHTPGVQTTKPFTNADPAHPEAMPKLFETDASTFLARAELQHEVFGPSTILVWCHTADDVMKVARQMEGSLTATIHGTTQDLEEHRQLIATLARKAGRLVYNGYPTGVEVCASMQHGGPYPATTDPRFTSVGTAAIQRFARPVCFQDFPTEFLPAELRS